MKTHIKERPIPFSADMVRALLQGWKTQTSRTRGLERFNGWPDRKIPLGEDAWELCHFTKEEPGIWRAIFQDPRGECPPGLDPVVKCPYGKPGERLCVRDPFFNVYDDWFRLLLEITDIEARKLQSITEEEAMAEGIESIFYDEETSSTGWKNYLDPESMCIRARDSFFTLWDRLHGAGEAETDPWVWMIKFKVLIVKGTIK